VHRACWWVCVGSRGLSFVALGFEHRPAFRGVKGAGLKVGLVRLDTSPAYKEFSVWTVFGIHGSDESHQTGVFLMTGTVLLCLLRELMLRDK